MHRLDGMVRLVDRSKSGEGGVGGLHNITFAFQFIQRVHDEGSHEGMEGINFNRINITDIRYADDAVLVADK